MRIISFILYTIWMVATVIIGQALFLLFMGWQQNKQIQKTVDSSRNPPKATAGKPVEIQV